MMQVIYVANLLKTAEKQLRKVPCAEPLHLTGIFSPAFPTNDVFGYIFQHLCCLCFSTQTQESLQFSEEGTVINKQKNPDPLLSHAECLLCSSISHFGDWSWMNYQLVPAFPCLCWEGTTYLAVLHSGVLAWLLVCPSPPWNLHHKPVRRGAAPRLPKLRPSPPFLGYSPLHTRKQEGSIGPLD